uniref:Vacuolar amino acid transporter 4 n=1 Tax=Lygus hesperus TaxID=30085 RepID=A0A0A9ZID2_LYGHE
MVHSYIERLDVARAEIVAKRREIANPIQRVFAKVIPYGGLLSCGVNLAGCCIGAGVISLPSAFMMSGLAMALVYMVVISILTVYSYYIMGIVGRRTGLRNYEEIVLTLMGPMADYILVFCV